MADLAEDVAAVIGALAEGRATVAGHAFGNPRMVATRQPRGRGRSPTGLRRARSAHSGGDCRYGPVFNASLEPNARLDAIARAFFAPGHDSSPWEGGWHAATAAAQVAATAATPVEEWWTAGSADVLMIQPADDVVAVPENAAEWLARRCWKDAGKSDRQFGWSTTPQRLRACFFLTAMSFLTSDLGKGRSIGNCRAPVDVLYLASSSFSSGKTDPLCGR